MSNMKKCPVCNAPVEELYTGLCPNPDCTWEFEFIGAEPTQEMKKRYEEKLNRAQNAYSRLINDVKQKENKIESIDTIDPFTDSDDVQKYKSVKIGNQVWMAENLNADRFRNGDAIPEAKTNKEWLEAGKNSQPAWCYYNNDPANGLKYGKLYNWYAVNDPRGLSPKGWHVPSWEEWILLIEMHGVAEIDNVALKDNHGLDEVGIDKTGFRTLLGGCRDSNGVFYGVGKSGYWWTQDKPESHFHRVLGCSYGIIGRHISFGIGLGFSFRCLRND